MLIVSFFITVACEKDFNPVVDNIESVVVDNDSLSPLGELDPDADVFVNLSNEKAYAISEYAIRTASQPKHIPIYQFRCYENYKWTYKHVKQPDGTSCSWTSYAICTGNVVNAFGAYYPVNINQVYKVRDGCGWGKYIGDLCYYANSIDRKYVRARVVSFEKKYISDFEVIKQMMLLLYVNKTPFVAIAKSGSYTHYVVVYGIHWGSNSLKSIIYFTDPLDYNYGSFNSNVRSMDLYEFVRLMRTNSNNNFNFLEILFR